MVKSFLGTKISPGLIYEIISFMILILPLALLLALYLKRGKSNDKEI